MGPGQSKADRFSSVRWKRNRTAIAGDRCRRAVSSQMKNSAGPRADCTPDGEGIEVGQLGHLPSKQRRTCRNKFIDKTVEDRIEFRACRKLLQEIPQGVSRLCPVKFVSGKARRQRFAKCRVVETFSHKKTRTLTGCLQKSDDANEYNLVTGKGGTREIKSDSVDLAPHVGHTVTVTGVVSNATMHGVKEDAKAEAKEHGMDKSSTERGHLAVTDVKMVSDSCNE